MSKMIVMGRRSQNIMDIVMPTSVSRLVVLDDTTRNPVVAEWQYEGETTRYTGNAFFDEKPNLTLVVSAANYSPVTLRPCNVGFQMTPHNGRVRNPYSTYTGMAVSFAVIPSPTLSVQGWGGEYALSYPRDIDNHNAKTFACIQAGCTVMLRTDNSIYAWGEWSQTSSAIPADILARKDIRQVASANINNFVLLAEKAPFVQTWGEQSFPVPDDIASMDNIMTIIATSSGGGCYAALTDSGQVFSWGSMSMPPDIQNLTDITHVFSNNYSFIVRRATGQLAGWGANGGDDMPDTIKALTDVTRVFNGLTSYCALRENGSVVAWGNTMNDPGEVPADIAALTNIVDVQYTTGSQSPAFFIALCSDGSVVGWSGLGPGYPQMLPIPEALTDVVSLTLTPIAVGSALTSRGTVVSWGLAAPIMPEAQESLHDIQAVYAGFGTLLALKSDGEITVWGESSNGGSVLSVPENVQGAVSYYVE